MSISVILISYILQTLSKSLGLFRDMLTAQQLGATSEGDAYMIGMVLPALFVNIGGMAFIPLVAADLAVLDGEKWGKRLRDWYWIVGLIAIIPTLPAILWSQSCIHFAAPSLSPAIQWEAQQVFILFCLNAVVWLLNIVLTAAFNSRQSFILPGILSLNIPLGVCVGLLLKTQLGGLPGVAACSLFLTCIAHVLGLMALKPYLRRFRFSLPNIQGLLAPLKHAFPYIMACICTTLSLVLFHRSLNTAGIGNITLYTLADRLWGVVGGLVSIISLYLVPRYARSRASIDEEQKLPFPGQVIAASAALYITASSFFVLIGSELFPFLFARGATSMQQVEQLGPLVIQNGLVDFFITTGYFLEHYLIATGRRWFSFYGGLTFFISATFLFYHSPSLSSTQLLTLYGIAAGSRFLVLLTLIIFSERSLLLITKKSLKFMLFLIVWGICSMTLSEQIRSLLTVLTPLSRFVFGLGSGILLVSPLLIVWFKMFSPKSHALSFLTTPYQCWGKRTFDVVVGLTLLVLISPVFLLVFVAVKASSKGPVFYHQRRIGLHGNSFYLLKFRTMFDAVRPLTIQVRSSNPEVTLVGRFLRRTKLDELPQLLNVIRGDMTLVGPRPAITEVLDAANILCQTRILVRPGLTGLAQVHGNSYLSWPERWRYDSEYVHSYSFFGDLRILCKTLLVIVIGEEALLERPTIRIEEGSQNSKEII